jgi:hypothetical protein
MKTEIKVSEGPYGLIRLEGLNIIYVNTNGIFDKFGKKIVGMKKIKRLLGLEPLVKWSPKKSP